jgi:hypothetical protein
MEIIDVGVKFYHRLANRDKLQGDGAHTAVEFRKQYLNDLDSPNAWKVTEPYIELNFEHVKRLGPSFANEAFAYFTKYTDPETIYKRIIFKNLSKVQKSIIEVELKTGYKR